MKPGDASFGGLLGVEAVLMPGNWPSGQGRCFMHTPTAFLRSLLLPPLHPTAGQTGLPSAVPGCLVSRRQLTEEPTSCTAPAYCPCPPQSPAPPEQMSRNRGALSYPHPQTCGSQSGRHSPLSSQRHTQGNPLPPPFVWAKENNELSILCILRF